MTSAFPAFPFLGDVFPELARLQQQLDHAFERGPASNIRSIARGAFPAVNVGSSPESVEVIAFAPGVDAKALEITIDKGLLVIAGERKGAHDGDGSTQGKSDNVYARERFAGSFRRVVSLPEDADPARVDAKFRDGLLHITVAKRESSRPRQIAVN
jgi:HSP20 family protein